MVKLSLHVWIIVGLIVSAVGALTLSACGSVNMSGEPETVAEREIAALPTPLPTAVPATSVPETPALDMAATESAPPSESEEIAPAAAQSATEETTLPGDYALGQQLFITECAACHGAQDGAGPKLGGMGERAATRVAGMSAAEYVAQSIVDPGAFIVEGYQDVMPKTYAQDLSQDEIDSIVRFIVEFDPASVMGGQTTGSATATPVPAIDQENVLTVTGRLVQGTSNGEPVPAGLGLDLYALDANGSLIGVYQTTSGENAVYTFEDVPRAAGNIYLVQISYADVAQGARINAIQGNETTITQDLTVYERTADSSRIAVTLAQMLINYAPINEFGLEVWLRVELANTGDRIVTTEEISDSGWLVSVPIELPVGAFGIQPMQQDGSNRYQVDLVDGVPVVKDTWPLRPGQVHTITVAYYLPYRDGAVIDQSMYYPVVDAMILMPNDTVELRSDQFDTIGAWRYRVTSGGTRVVDLSPDEKIDPEKDFTLVKEHALLTPLAADERMVFELVGRPTRTINLMATSSGGSDSGTDMLPLALAGLGVAVLVLAGVLYWRQRSTLAAASTGRSLVVRWKPPPATASKDDLLRAIAELDDAYQAGEIDESAYQVNREALMDRLVPLMDEDEA